jgi:hypothetical protein
MLPMLLPNTLMYQTKARQAVYVRPYFEHPPQSAPKTERKKKVRQVPLQSGLAALQ